ncbi:hypothetical protein HDU97_010150 [Phlyctochytrium planicorne]|nr:hypothetical protein HDU97_010150 [Phlyctochytrium planicorne]
MPPHIKKSTSGGVELGEETSSLSLRSTGTSPRPVGYLPPSPPSPPATTASPLSPIRRSSEPSFPKNHSLPHIASSALSSPKSCPSAVCQKMGTGLKEDNEKSYQDPKGNKPRRLSQPSRWKRTQEESEHMDEIDLAALLSPCSYSSNGSASTFSGSYYHSPSLGRAPSLQHYTSTPSESSPEVCEGFPILSSHCTETSFLGSSPNTMLALNPEPIISPHQPVVNSFSPNPKPHTQHSMRKEIGRRRSVSLAEQIGGYRTSTTSQWMSPPVNSLSSLDGPIVSSSFASSSISSMTSDRLLFPSPSQSPSIRHATKTSRRDDSELGTPPPSAPSKAPYFTFSLHSSSQLPTPSDQESSNTTLTDIPPCEEEIDAAVPAYAPKSPTPGTGAHPIPCEGKATVILPWPTPDSTIHPIYKADRAFQQQSIDETDHAPLDASEMSLETPRKMVGVGYSSFRVNKSLQEGIPILIDGIPRVELKSGSHDEEDTDDVDDFELEGENSFRYFATSPSSVKESIIHQVRSLLGHRVEAEHWGAYGVEKEDEDDDDFGEGEYGSLIVQKKPVPEPKRRQQNLSFSRSPANSYGLLSKRNESALEFAIDQRRRLNSKASHPYSYRMQNPSYTSPSTFLSISPMPAVNLSNAMAAPTPLYLAPPPLRGSFRANTKAVPVILSTSPSRAVINIPVKAPPIEIVVEGAQELPDVPLPPRESSSLPKAIMAGGKIRIPAGPKPLKSSLSSSRETLAEGNGLEHSASQCGALLASSYPAGGRHGPGSHWKCMCAVAGSSCGWGRRFEHSAKHGADCKAGKQSGECDEGIEDSAKCLVEEEITVEENKTRIISAPMAMAVRARRGSWSSSSSTSSSSLSSSLSSWTSLSSPLSVATKYGVASAFPSAVAAAVASTSGSTVSSKKGVDAANRKGSVNCNHPGSRCMPACCVLTIGSPLPIVAAQMTISCLSHPNADEDGGVEAVITTPEKIRIKAVEDAEGIQPILENKASPVEAVGIASAAEALFKAEGAKHADDADGNVLKVAEVRSGRSTPTRRRKRVSFNLAIIQTYDHSDWLGRLEGHRRRRLEMRCRCWVHRAYRGVKKVIRIAKENRTVVAFGSSQSRHHYSHHHHPQHQYRPHHRQLPHMSHGSIGRRRIGGSSSLTGHRGNAIDGRPSDSQSVWTWLSDFANLWTSTVNASTDSMSGIDAGRRMGRSENRDHVSSTVDRERCGRASDELHHKTPYLKRAVASVPMAVAGMATDVAPTRDTSKFVESPAWGCLSALFFCFGSSTPSPESSENFPILAPTPEQCSEESQDSSYGTFESGSSSSASTASQQTTAVEDEEWEDESDDSEDEEGDDEEEIERQRLLRISKQLQELDEMDQEEKMAFACTKKWFKRR